MDVNLLINQAIAAGNAQNWPMAENLYRQAYQVDPANGEVTNGMGIALRLQGRSDEAAEWYNKTLALGSQKAGNVNQAAEQIARNGLIQIATESGKPVQIGPIREARPPINETAAALTGFVGGGLLGGAAGAAIGEVGRVVTKSAGHKMTGKYALIGGGITSALGATLGWLSARAHNRRPGTAIKEALTGSQSNQR